MTARRFTDEEEQQIARDYLAGKSSQTIAQERDIGDSLVFGVLERQGVSRRRPHEKLSQQGRAGYISLHRFTPVEEDELVEKYQAGTCIDELARQKRCSPNAIKGLLRRHGVPIRNGGPHPSLNQHAFDDAEHDEAAAYFAGLIMADGSVSLHKRGYWSIKLGLAEEDAEHIRQFRDFLGSTHKINVHFPTNNLWQGQPCHSLTIGSKQLATALLRYGVGPGKTHAGRVRLLESNRHFWRGMVCGDGCLYLRGGKAPGLVLAGSRDNMDLFLAFCKTITSTETVVRPHSTIWSVHLSGGHAYRVIDRLFVGASVALPRKQAIADHFFTNYSRFATVFRRSCPRRT